MRSRAVQDAERLMTAFAARTGVRGGGDPVCRYLWTDAYGVLAMLALHRATGVDAYRDDAVRLAQLVHEVLGRHREGDARAGWISGLSEDEGMRRPTAGGLRIGKPLRERAADEPLDEQLEWERDGQYFHYLTKWMQALAQLGLATGDPAWIEHAVTLAHVAVRGFVHTPRLGAPQRMHWKMSVDLTRPLVASMGQHDPLDGLATILFVRAARHRLSPQPAALDTEIEILRAICARHASWSTTDPLGIGGLLADAAMLIELVGQRDIAFESLLHTILSDAHRGLDFALDGGSGARMLSQPTEVRLAFRELGLCMGLRAIGPMQAAMVAHPDRFLPDASAAALRVRLDAMQRAVPVADRIEATWLDPATRETRGWVEHRDINDVMLAASLLAGEAPLVGLGSVQGSHGRPREGPDA